MIKIGEFAKICNISTQTLRYYDSEGVLKADITDSSSGYRFYSIDAVEKYKQIVFYKNLGFSLEEIKKIQSATSEELKDILQKKKEVLSDSIEKFKHQLKTIDDLLGGNMNMPGLSEVFLLPYKDDPCVVGKWQLCGKLLDENDFASLEEVNGEMADKEIIFMPGGAFAWKYFWTKGTLYRISAKYKFAIPNLYRITEQDGIRYMIVQFMDDACIDNGEDALVLLYRQVDTVAYTEYQIRPNVDNTDLPFEEDESVHGLWKVFDYIPEISDFDPHKRFSGEDDIYITDIHFYARGICTRRIRSTTKIAVKRTLRYTKGFVLDDKEKTAEEYRIKSINGKEYLFVQHKSGDYIYGGITPHWYVFERECD